MEIDRGSGLFSMRKAETSTETDYSYLVEVDGRVCRKHADQLKSKSTNGSDRETPPKGAHNDCHHRHHSLSGTETEPETFHDIPQDSGEELYINEPLTIFGDNQAAIAMSKNQSISNDRSTLM